MIHTLLDDLMFQFDQLVYLWVQADLHRYQNELEQYLHLQLNVFQYHELKLEEPERENISMPFSLISSYFIIILDNF